MRHRPFLKTETDFLFTENTNTKGISMSLQDRAALITGSTSGIGLGIARAMAGKGANIMLNGFGDSQEIEEIRQGLENEYGITAAYSDADLTSRQACDDLVEETQARLGGFDILVNNAGVQHVSVIEDFPREKWDLIITLMLTSPFWLLQKALPKMKERKWGRIINVSSAHGKVASMQKAAYVSAKHGLIGLNKVTALEGAEYGVTSNAICPGWVLTPLVEKQVDAIAEIEGISWEQAREKLLSEKQPMVEFTKPEQIGALACYLASDDAATITGAEFSIDGGWTAR